MESTTKHTKKKRFPRNYIMVGIGVFVHLFVLVGIGILIFLSLQRHVATHKKNGGTQSTFYSAVPARKGSFASSGSSTVGSHRVAGVSDTNKQGANTNVQLLERAGQPQDFLQRSLSAPDFTILSVKPSSLGNEPVLVYSFSNPSDYNLEGDCDSDALLWRSSDNAAIYAIHYDSRYGWVMSNGRQYYGYVAGNSLPDDTYYVRMICRGNKLYSTAVKITSGVYAGSGGVQAPVHTAIVIFDDRAENKPLNGIFNGINWGTNVWDVNKALSTDSINSIAFHAANATSGMFSFVTPQVLVSMQVYNASTQRSLVTFSCSGNPNISSKIAPQSAATVTTDWSVACKDVTVTSSNGGDMHIDSVIYANVSNTASDSTQTVLSQVLGNSTQGSLLDMGDKGYMNGSKFTTGGTGGTVSSLSVFVGNVDAAPNNQYQLAIYEDAGGAPGKLLAQSTTGTLKPLAWNTIPVHASLTANTTYWLVYNTNSSSTDLNDMYYNSGSGVGAWAKQQFGVWPTTFPQASEDAIDFSIYATFQ